MMLRQGWFGSRLLEAGLSMPQPEDGLGILEPARPRPEIPAQLLGQLSHVSDLGALNCKTLIPPGLLSG